MKWRRGKGGGRKRISFLSVFEQAAALGFEHVLPPCARIVPYLARIEGPGQIEGPVVGL